MTPLFFSLFSLYIITDTFSFVKAFLLYFLWSIAWRRYEALATLPWSGATHHEAKRQRLISRAVGLLHRKYSCFIFHARQRASFNPLQKRKKALLLKCFRFWSGLRGSNPPPQPWQGCALPNELNPHMVPPVGIEPTTRRFSVSCSTNWATEAYFF